MQKTALSPSVSAFPFQLLITCFVFVMLLYANIELLPGTGAAATAKDILIALAGAGLVFGVNHYATAIGAKPAADGDPMALIVSVSGFILTAILVGTMSFAGMTVGLSERAALDRHSRDLAVAVSKAGPSETQTLISIMKSAGADFGSQASGERQEGRTTGKKSKPGGREPVADFYVQMHGRIKTATVSLEETERQNAEAIKALKTHVDTFAKTTADETLNRAERRQKLQRIDGDVRSRLGSLDTKMASGILRATLAEMRTPVVADAGTPDLRRGLEVAKEVSSAHAARLEEQLSTLDGDPAAVPPFPEPARVTAGFRNLAETWPYAVLSYGLELIGGFSIWLYTVIHHRTCAREEVTFDRPKVAAPETTACTSVASNSFRLEASRDHEGPDVLLGVHPHRQASKARMLEQDSGRAANGTSRRKMRNDADQPSEEGAI